MFHNIKTKVKRRINSYASIIFKSTISISDSENGKKGTLPSEDYYSYKSEAYTYHGKSPYWMDFKDIKLRSFFIKKSPNVEVIDRGIIVNNKGGIELESTVFQEEYLFKLNANHWVFFRKLLPSVKVEKAIVLTNYLDNNYYHWLLESIGRLTQIHPQRLQDYKLIIDSKAPGFVRDSLHHLLDIPPENIFPKSRKRLKVADALIPSFPHTRSESSAWTNIYSPSMIQKIHALSKQKTLLHTTKRNFIISRKNASERRILNVEVLLEKYKHLALEVVALEDLSFIEQMQLFRNAGVIIGAHGAGFANLLFSEQAFVIEFFPTNRNNRDAFYFQQITSALNLNHTVIEYDAENESQDLFLEEAILTSLDEILSNYN